ncbi:TRAP transporter permease DctM/Q [Zobellella endophytica]|uniref:TRAP transporter permease DctM/Q n=1 Tax=Zobellella endophytica TaxID=2116700 RepID=A0A2P7R1S2_9GAMM|nr:TRAP transporter fused permease subunit [Zobellella endophytica]PSJ44134.1 TRAP transporter permease DctM/Q [Zobellella endophytica]
MNRHLTLLQGYCTLLLGLAIAFIGIINAMPQFGLLPRFGPFNHEWLRPTIFFIAVLAVVIKQPFTSLLGQRASGLMLPGLMLDLALVGLAGYAFYDYYIVLKALNEALFFFEASNAYTALIGCVVILLLCWRIWGLALALVGTIGLLYFYTGEYWPGLFKRAPLDFVNATAESLWYNTANGVLGSLLGIVISTILPFILLGAVLESSGGGSSMIRIAFKLFRKSPGGPAHAAILASSMFGSVSGSAVANVVGTGVITIPMIRKRGFPPAFAGGVEATASTGGQIMPPIMGAAALVMADFTGVSYLTIIVAALIPALFYYGSLFVAVVYEARRLGDKLVQSREADEVIGEPTRQDYLNLLMVVVPILVIVLALVAGVSAPGSGILALFTLIPLSLILNPAVRKTPLKLLLSLAEGGYNFAALLMCIGAVGIVVGVLGATGLPTDFAMVVSQSAEGNLFISMLMAMGAALVLGMGMPTLPAYLTIILIMGPAMLSFGLEPLTAHMFVFYFGVASAITPPVAIAAFAAASISQASPLKTSVEATRIGLVIFVIPFAFVYYPELLLVAEAGPAYAWHEVLSIFVRLAFAVLLFSSALARFDRHALSAAESILRLVLGIGVLITSWQIHWAAFAIGLALLAVHRYKLNVKKELLV